MREEDSSKEISNKDKPIPKRKKEIKGKPNYNDLISTYLVISCQVETVLQCSTESEAAKIPEEEEQQQHFPKLKFHFPFTSPLILSLNVKG